jgi:hypothetical protein
MAERLAFLLDGIPEAERLARCRELRALALVYCGSAHAIPALRRRRLLASYGALMRRVPGSRA